MNPQLKIVVTESDGRVITINHSACKPEEMPDLCAVVAANDRFQDAIPFWQDSPLYPFSRTMRFCEKHNQHSDIIDVNRCGKCTAMADAGQLGCP